MMASLLLESAVDGSDSRSIAVRNGVTQKLRARGQHEGRALSPPQWRAEICRPRVGCGFALAAQRSRSAPGVLISDLQASHLDQPPRK
jgi:hypothetical protein